VLSQGKQLINLEPKQILKYMEELPFTEVSSHSSSVVSNCGAIILQALVVADAYKQCVWVDWVNPLYQHVVKGGDFRYLYEYKMAFPLSSTIFTDLAGK
jgi:hypothetical protein